MSDGISTEETGGESDNEWSSFMKAKVSLARCHQVKIRLIPPLHHHNMPHFLD